MSAQAISLSRLSQQTIPYESQPVAMSQELQESVRKTVIADLITIPFLFFVPSFLFAAAGLGFFSILVYPSNALLFIAGLLASVAVFLIPACILSLLAVLFILAVSDNMTQPVPEYVHWLALAASIPAGIGAVVVGLTTISVLVIVAITLIVWALIFAVAITVIGGLLSAR